MAKGGLNSLAAPWLGGIGGRNSSTFLVLADLESTFDVAGELALSQVHTLAVQDMAMQFNSAPCNLLLTNWILHLDDMGMQFGIEAPPVIQNFTLVIDDVSTKFDSDNSRIQLQHNLVVGSIDMTPFTIDGDLMLQTCMPQWCMYVNRFIQGGEAEQCLKKV